MTRDDVFPSKYLRAADLGGKPYVLTISDAPYEKLKGLDGKDTHKIVLSFKGAEKTLPLNATNFDAVAEATGCPDTDDWPGNKIELYPTRTTMGGKQVDCIRIRKHVPQTVEPEARPIANGSPAAPRRMAAMEPRPQQGQWKTSSGPAPIQPAAGDLPADEIPF
jgi:hypothetical protein